MFLGRSLAEQLEDLRPLALEQLGRELHNRHAVNHQHERHDHRPGHAPRDARLDASLAQGVGRNRAGRALAVGSLFSAAMLKRVGHKGFAAFLN